MKLMSDLSLHGPIRIAVIGAGLMGSGLVAQLNRLAYMDVIYWSSRRQESLLEKAKEIGISDKAIVISNTLEAAEEAYKRHGIALGVENAFSWLMEDVDVIVDCTGSTEAGCVINDKGLDFGKHIVSFNVECDVLLGPYFKEKAERKNLCYTGVAGDEPGAIMELYDFATFLGFSVVAAGKGKNNPMNVSATPESLEDEAKKRGLSARMLTSFVDATNTMIELNAVANATGLLPDVEGCHGIVSTIDELHEQFKQLDEGGDIHRKGILEYVMGIAPGVFVVVESDEPIINQEMAYLSMGEGPYYVLYRPYHLTNIEAPLSIAKAFLYREATITPRKGYIAHTVAVAKKDLYPGDVLDGIGSDTAYGVLADANVVYEEGAVPIGLIVGDVKVKKSIKKGEKIRFEDIVLDKKSELVKIFIRENEKFFSLSF